MDSVNPEAEKPVENPEKKDMVMTITMKASGGIEVQGPGNGNLYNEPMCLYLLRKAELFIEAHNQNALRAKLVKPSNGGIMKFVRGGIIK